MTSPAEPTQPSPAPFLRPFTHTPYPDVLNPIEVPEGVNAPPVAPIITQTLQEGKQQYTHEVPSRLQFHSVISHDKDSQIGQNTEPYYRSPNLVENDGIPDLGASNDLFVAFSGYEQVTFPGWFITSFDQHDLFSMTDLVDVNFGVQKNDVGSES